MGSHHNGINLGLSYIAAVLKKESYNVRIYNADYYDSNAYINQRQIFENYDAYKKIINDLSDPIWTEIKENIVKFNPDIIGITMFTANYKVAKVIAKIAKGFNDNIKIIVGGVHPTIDPEGTLKNNEFNFLVRGEGEVTFLEFVKGKRYSEIQGLSYKKNGKIIHNKARPFIKDLDTLSFPSRDLFINRTRNMDFGNIITGRGCPYSCIYCASKKIWHKKVRFRSAENVVKELIYLKENYNSPLIYFVDDTFTLNRNRAKEICRGIIKKSLDIEWKCDTRVDCLDYELVNLMKKSGCIRIKIGVETGSEKILKRIKKGLTKDKIRKGVDIIKRVGIPLTVYLMAGFPEETNNDIKETIEFGKEIDADYYSLSIVAPYLGTEIYDEYLKSSTIVNKEHWEFFYHQSRYVILNKNIDPKLIDEFLALNEKPGKGVRV
jgi:radical SAM superfamily enzyme YgiQ (UPF0313 family)